MALLSKDNSVRRSLVLAGGGVRLAYHAGVLQALEEAGLTFNHVDGTSGGIFGTAMLASGITPMDAASRWRNLKLRGFMGAVPLESFDIKKIGNGANGIRKSIYPALGIDIARINGNTLFDATFNVCNFSRKTVESIPHNQVTEDHLIAGMSLPMFMPATKIGKDWYTDAVWIKDANLKEAIARGAEDIWLVWGIGNTPAYHKGYFIEYVAMIEISASGGLFWELEDIKRENDDRLKRGERPIQLHIIKPDYPLPLDPDFFFKKIDGDTLISMGYADTRAYLKAATPFDFSDIPAATAMHEAEHTLHFRQQFKGRAVWEGREQHIEIRLACFVRNTQSGYMLQSFSTVETEDGMAAPGHRNELCKSDSGILIASFCVRTANGTNKVTVQMDLTSIIDFMLGMDIQNATVNIAETIGRDTVYTFYQPTLNRIRNAMHLSMIGTDKPWVKMKMKWRSLQYLLQ